MNTIQVRHDLRHQNKALLASLDWDYTVDPDAPECVHFTPGRNPEVQPGGCKECREIECHKVERAQ